MKQLTMRTHLVGVSIIAAFFAAVTVGTSAIGVNNLVQANQRVRLDYDVRDLALALDAAVSPTKILDPERAESLPTLRAAESDVDSLMRRMSSLAQSGTVADNFERMIDEWKHYDSAAQSAFLANNHSPGNARNALSASFHRDFEPFERDLSSFRSERQSELDAAIDNFTAIEHGAWIDVFVPASIGALCIIIAILAFTRALTNRLARLSEIANHVSSGDLTHAVEIEADDELGKVTAAFARMLEYLRRVADVSEAMSHGDLRKTLTPAGDSDALSAAVNRMVRSLRDMVSRVHSAAESVNDGAANISASSAELTRSSTEQAVSAEQTSAAMEEVAANISSVDRYAQTLGDQVSLVRRESTTLEAAVSGTTSAISELAVSIRQVAQNVANANAVSGHASEAASGGENAVARTVAGMTEISDAMNGLREAITSLESRSNEIGAIVNVIDDIADQTNLLALNAAIEAARAGEAGRGFAVVADEVRKLSDLSANATKQIAQLIAGIQRETGEAVRVTEEGSHRVAEGVRLANATGAALAEIKTSAVRVAQLLSDVSIATGEQAGTSEHIVSAAEEMARVNAQVMSAMAEMTSATEFVAQASAEQRQGTSQVVQAVELLSRTSTNSATATKRVASAAEDLSGQAKSLQDLVAVFKLGNEDDLRSKLF